MTTRLNPYLNFRDTAKPAMEFYQSVFGGELTFTFFSDFPGMAGPDEDTKVMHSQLITDGGLAIMGSDTPARMDLEDGTNFSVSLSGEWDSADELHGYWDKLSVDAEILTPLEQAPWGDSFGMCIDRFGVRWLFNFSGAPQ